MTEIEQLKETMIKFLCMANSWPLGVHSSRRTEAMAKELGEDAYKRVVEACRDVNQHER